MEEEKKMKPRKERRKREKRRGGKKRKKLGGIRRNPSFAPWRKAKHFSGFALLYNLRPSHSHPTTPATSTGAMN